MLTPKQEKFCLVYMQTGNATEAYRQAYSTGNMKPATVNRKAKEVIDNGNIGARLAELKQPAIEAAQLSLTQHLMDLQRLRDAAWADEKYGPAVVAEVSRGRASGLYIEKIQHSGTVIIAATPRDENI